MVVWQEYTSRHQPLSHSHVCSTYTIHVAENTITKPTRSLILLRHTSTFECPIGSNFYCLRTIVVIISHEFFPLLKIASHPWVIIMCKLTRAIIIDR